jgi:hypothetical protein
VRGFANLVIIVTHSMGGLLGRALLHPGYGNMLNDKNVKILGIYHNVMPTMGAASAYKRMRFGFQKKKDTRRNSKQKCSVLMAGTPRQSSPMRRRRWK